MVNILISARILIFDSYICKTQVFSCRGLDDNKNIIMCSFKSSGDIQKKEGGPDSCFG